MLSNTGQAVLWQCLDKKKSKRVSIFPHGEEQIYACEMLNDGNVVTAAGNLLRVWDVKQSGMGGSGTKEREASLTWRLEHCDGGM